MDNNRRSGNGGLYGGLKLSLRHGGERYVEEHTRLLNHGRPMRFEITDSGKYLPIILTAH